MDGCHRRITAICNFKQSVGKALIVVNDVIAVASHTQKTVCAESERKWLRETSAAHADELILVKRRGKIPDILDLEEVIGVVKIEAGNFVQDDSLIQFRIRGPGKDVDLVTYFPQRPAQVLYIDPLPAAGGVSTVCEETDPQKG